MSDSLAGQAAARAARERQIEALIAHPAMPDAVRMMCSGLVQLFQGNRLLNLIASDRARMMMAFMATYLDARYDPRDPLSGLTVNRYKALCASTGLCSPGRGAAMLGIMRFAGYLEPATRAHRGLPLRLVPTEKLLTQQRTRWRLIFSALSLVREEAAWALAHLDDPTFDKVFVRHGCDLFLARERPIEHAPALPLFADHKAGLMVLMRLMLSAAPESGMPPTGPVSMPIARLARNFAVSRAQVTEILRSATDAGLFRPIGGDPPAYLLSPELRDSIVRYIAAMFVLSTDALAATAAEFSNGGPDIGAVA
jgi:hypothetical protein